MNVSRHTELNIFVLATGIVSSVLQLSLRLLQLTLVFVAVGCDATESKMNEPVPVIVAESADIAAQTAVGDVRPIQSWKLPKQLREISGLAADDRGRIYAVADEQAHVFVLNPLTGTTLSVFGLGNPAVKGDFEGIALHDHRLYLITADGTLLRTLLAQSSGTNSDSLHDGAKLGYEAFALNTGCSEIEGLASAPDGPRLWLVCKLIEPSHMAGSGSANGASTEAVIRLEAWSTETRELLPNATLELPLAGVLSLTGQKKFKPSGLVFVPAYTEEETKEEETVGTWDLLIISGAQRSYSRFRWAVNSESGRVPQLLSAGRLNSRHRQAEGIEVGVDRTLFVADEGAGKRARLRVYPAGALP